MITNVQHSAISSNGGNGELSVSDDIQRFDHHKNAFGFLRFLFASLVICSHVPEIVDGNSSREILSSIFGTISFGELAVDGFFIISGFLISASFVNNSNAKRFLLKRVARIYPGFLVSSLICLTAVAAMGGAIFKNVPALAYHAAINGILLRSPENFGAFAGSNYPELNGAMWTIAYEFRCYVLACILGLAGMIDRKNFLAFLATICLVGMHFVTSDLNVRLNSWHLYSGVWLGDAPKALRLTGMFLAGATFRAKQDDLSFRPSRTVICGLMLFGLLFSRYTANFGVAIFGAYLIFGIAKNGRGSFIERINNKNDISYGVYLYAWPIEKLLIANGWGHSLLALGLMTWLTSIFAGAASWFLVERPVMTLLRSRNG